MGIKVVGGNTIDIKAHMEPKPPLFGSLLRTLNPAVEQKPVPRLIPRHWLKP